ncbi:hypothetical protein PHLGIDRAFT_74530 [Phlebiopsis gigantea 11061_1 CR5-6]|uniref:AB hydrolase-1 domain-containing protein n=1 Tax=Phlebiopsis gigantea (strain 11061_1 CR5-6) TaxID=745531 RepID=A0A0C3PHC3_PHLG1|nr:hypothetical protein PHLGIDRAFT_74530 [Phlebiopsis gigantea 11061_1 CR5-6]
MHCQRHVIRLPDALGGLQCAVNSYRQSCTCTSGGVRCDGLVLVFAHCTSTHKEHWEPTLEKLFALAAATDQFAICEAWSIDCANHGDSALLNDAQLSDKEPLTVKDYAALLRYFVNSELLADRRKVIGVGHSSSTSACTLETLPLSFANLSALILVEPVMVPPPILQNDPRIVTGQRNVVRVLKRRDTWDSLDAARGWLAKQIPYKIWDPRILDIYVEYGLHTVRDAAGKEHVTYKCKLSQEVAFYTHEDHVLAGEKTAAMCGRMPVHSIFGERPEMVYVSVSYNLFHVRH